MAAKKTPAKYTSRQVAGYFLNKARKRFKCLDYLQVAKFVYLAHCWHLGIHGTPLVKENVDAWPYGPFMRVLYFDTRRLPTRWVPNDHFEEDYRIAKWTDETKEFLDTVWARYKVFSGIQLSNICRAKGSPWAQVALTHSIVPEAVIRKYYKEFWEREKKADANLLIG